MKISCPVCDKEKDIDYGKYICSDCNSKFEYQTDGVIKIIKRNKFDYWTFLIALAFPIMFIIFLFNDTARGNFYNDFNIFSGLVMVFYPFLIVIRQIFHLGFDTVTLIDLYVRFFKKELRKEDNGRIIGFYLTFATNITGIILILIKLMN